LFSQIARAVNGTLRKLAGESGVMKYDAITLDANIFFHNGFYLEGGMLGQLVQFKEGSAQFVLSEIVFREVYKYVKLHAAEANSDLEKAIKKCGKNGVVSNEAIIQLNSIRDAALNARDAAKKRLKTFQDETGFVIVTADQANIKELVSRYFEPAAPFEASGKKKNEFPDAIALLSLEAWAKTNKKKILAISDDGGWVDFAKNSQFIDVERDLAAALQILQKHAAQAEAVVAALLADLDSGNSPELLDQLTREMSDAVSSLEVEVDGNAAYHFEAELADMTYEIFRFLQDDGKYDFKIVQTGNNKIVARVGVSVSARASAHVSFAIWDSEDKEYIPMGNQSIQSDEEFEAGALVTFEGDFSATSPDVVIAKLELVDAINSIDFGELSPNSADDYYDEYA
jgi:hypothetical protein